MHEVARRFGLLNAWPGRPDLVAHLDELVSGGPRTADLTWYEKVPRVSIHATATGYAVVRTLGDDLIVGPAAGTTPRDGADVVTAAIAATPSAARFASPSPAPTHSSPR